MVQLKQFLRILVLIAILVLTAIILHLKNTNKVLKEDLFNTQTELEVKTGENIITSNKLNQDVTTTYVYEKTIDGLKHSTDSIERSMYKQIKASNLKIKQLNDIISIYSTASGGGVFDSTVIIIHDTITIGKTIKYFDDGYLSLEVYEDSISYKYNSNYTIIGASHMTERNFFLWRWIGWLKEIDKDLVEIVSSNPNEKFLIRKVKIK
jgi:hypothetical protein